MWQSCVEIEYYSIDHVTAFKVLHLCTSIKGGAQAHCVHLKCSNYQCNYTSTICMRAPSLLEVQRYRTLNAVMRSKYVTE